MQRFYCALLTTLGLALFTGEEFSLSLIVDEDTKSTLNVHYQIISVSQASQRIVLHYSLSGTNRFYDESGREEATNPIEHTCNGAITLKFGENVSILHGTTISYDIRAQPYVNEQATSEQ